MSKELRKRLRAVDPDLKIVPSYARKGRLTLDEWNKSAGVICSTCDKEVFRSRDGLCMSCWESAHEIEVRDNVGALNLLPESVIMSIVHKANNKLD